jgi:hypothetical protein
MPGTVVCTGTNPRWQAALREQNDDVLVRCGVCDRVGIVLAPPGADTSRDRENWPWVPCVLKVRCVGSIGREFLN